MRETNPTSSIRSWIKNVSPVLVTQTAMVCAPRHLLLVMLGSYNKQTSGYVVSDECRVGSLSLLPHIVPDVIHKLRSGWLLFVRLVRWDDLSEDRRLNVRPLESWSGHQQGRSCKSRYHHSYHTGELRYSSQAYEILGADRWSWIKFYK
jgi:hypothetical protein